MRKIPLGIMIGAALAGCFWIGESDAQASYKDGTFYVHKKDVTIQKVGQTCCDPTVTFYNVLWDGKVVNGTHFPCAHPHAIVGGAEPTPSDPNNIHKGRAYILGCEVVHRIKLRD